MHTSPSTPGGTFEGLGIAPKLLEILTKQKFVTPTPIQKQSIPSAISGKDLMGIAQTGTGKTLAFGIPMLQRLAQSGGKQKGLVILPTRELALQVNDTLKKIGGSLGLKTAILIGGESMGKQLSALRQNPHIVIATPGRLNDHLEQKTYNPSNVGVLVLDEADRMLDMGFLPQIKKVLERIPKERQTLLFSATMADDIVRIAKQHMTLPLRVEVAPAGTAVQTVSQEVFFVQRNDKAHLLKSLLGQYKGSVLVFSRTKHGAKKITRLIKQFGHTATEIHSNRTLSQRLDALKGFKLGSYRVMVATDIAARGIDVTGIELVINYDLPDNAEDYVHRIGRTGRAGLSGHAISFATPDQKSDIKAIERLIRKQLPVSKTPALERAPLPLPDRNEREERPERRERDQRRFPSKRDFKPRSGRDGFKPRGARGDFKSRTTRDDFKSDSPKREQRRHTPSGTAKSKAFYERTPSAQQSRGRRGGPMDRPPTRYGAVESGNAYYMKRRRSPSAE